MQPPQLGVLSPRSWSFAGLSRHQRLLLPIRGLSPSCSPLPGCLQLPTQAPLLWKRCFGAAGCTNANTARATAGKLEASQECFQVQVFLRCPGSAQSSDQQCLHEHRHAADRIPGFSSLLFSANVKLSCQKCITAGWHSLLPSPDPTLSVQGQFLEISSPV